MFLGRPATNVIHVQKLGYRPALDGLRGVAILLVIGKHAFNWPRQGGLGVDLFFVLSGFLITSLLLEEGRGGGGVSLRRFYRRRALRLFPALATMLLGYLAVMTAKGELGSAVRPLALAVTYTANIALAGDRHAMPAALAHLWSLAEEEQFYLVWPPLLLLVLRFRPRWIQQLTVSLIILVILDRARLGAAGVTLDRIYFAPDSHAEPLLIGCLFGLWQAQGLPAALKRPAMRRRLALASALSFLAATVLLDRFWAALYATPLFTVVCTAAAIVVLTAARDAGGVARLLRARPLVFIGRISYGLYIWHLPILAAFGASALDAGFAVSAIAVTLALLIASLSYTYIELPFLRRKHRPESSRVSGKNASPALQGVQ
jgi:peptidoglycan/LPS O-acetylase OafA/YrhL